MLSVFFALTSCETLKDPVVELGPVYPLSGEWIVRFIKESPIKGDTSKFVTVTTSNDASNSTTSLWLRKTSNSFTTDTSSVLKGKILVKSFTVKATCNVDNKSFNVDNGANTVLAAGASVGTCKVTNGKVTIDGWDTATGHKSDKITFKFEDSRTPGVVYTAEGYRRTGWLDDEP
ncbi:MAG: hypothetical protein GZ091_12020 [Paludibacter sp.]|nr:hypothetical protein [Paludibacter sp.]